MEAMFEDVSDAVWEQLQRRLPNARAKPLGGQPRFSDRVAFAAIVYGLRTGCLWKALPAHFSSGSTCHLRLQPWMKAGVFENIFRELVRFYDNRRGIQWKWTSLDGATV
jgi:transposase